MGDKSTFWKVYIPDEKSPWNVQRVLHLHRRAGLGATWAEVQRDVKEGPRASIDRLLNGKARRDGLAEDFARTATTLADAAVAARDPGRLKAWWVYRMLFGPDPLTERLVLLWHNHFATSLLKVGDLALMRRQNDLFREHARAPFGKLLAAAVRDPALLVWLDAQVNRKGHANENLARELMELFTLGVGHYSERDVKEAARALTGWTVTDGVFADVPGRHDDGEKTILGRTGRWKGADLVKILLAHPATARRLAWRLCTWLMGEKTVSAAGMTELADGLRRRDLDIGWAVETILRSRAFFAGENLARRVSCPVEFVLGALRALEAFDAAPSTLLLGDWLARLGQDLFYPPNVGGWPGGRAWLSTRTVLARTDLAWAIVEGRRIGRPPLDALGLARRHGATRRQALIDLACRLLLGTEATPAWHQRIERGVTVKDDAQAARQIVALTLAAPEAQLA